MMDNKQLIRELRSLCQLDIDAVHAYDQALNNIDSKQVKSRIESFKEDHRRHVKDLSNHIRTLGEEPPAFTPDLKGYLLEAFTKLRSISGTEGALKGLKGGEELTNKKYADAVKMDFPGNIKDLINRNFNDEKKHYQYIDEAIKSRLWEEAA